MRLSVFIVFCLFLTGAWTLPGLAGTHDTISRFDQKFREALSKDHIPGGAFAIIEHGRTTMLGTYGVRKLRGKRPVTKETVFRLASVSKTFTAELAALLIREGQFSWDDRVTDAVPEFELKLKGAAEQIRVRHILGHTTGLPPNAYDLMLEDGWSLSKIIPYFERLSPLYPPGKRYAYQNVMFSFIRPVIEKATGQSYETLIRERLFRPLHLDTASIGFTPFVSAPNHAFPHRKARGRWVSTRVNQNYYTVAPAAGINASIEDLAKWVRAQMGYVPDVIDDALVRTVTQKQINTPREKYRKGWRPHVTRAFYGFGWRIYTIGGRDIVLHAGGVAGFRSLVSYSRPLSVGLVILINAEGHTLNTLASEFWSGLARETASTGTKGS